MLAPSEDALLPSFGVGVTNLVDRPTRAASELAPDELEAGGRALARLVERWAPRLVAVVGVTAYRSAFGARDAALGLQPAPLGGRPVWVLPNPSGLNAHYQLPDLARLYGEARAHAASLAEGPP